MKKCGIDWMWFVFGAAVGEAWGSGLFIGQGHYAIGAFRALLSIAWFLFFMYTLEKKG